MAPITPQDKAIGAGYGVRETPLNQHRRKEKLYASLFIFFIGLFSKQKQFD